MAVDSCPDFSDSASPDEARDISVSAVLWVLVDDSEPSVEAMVDARLCFDGVRRRKLTGLDGADKPGLSETDLVDELEGPHSRPRNEVADFCTFAFDDSFSCSSLKFASKPCSFSRVTSLVKLTKSFTSSSADLA